MANGLTLKQETFVQEYLGEARGNATEAARRAGYKNPSQDGYDNLRKPHIRALIDEHLMAKSLTSAEVLAELTSVAMAPWQDFLQVRTNPRTGDVVDAKIVLSDKVKALELLGKYHKLFTERTEVSGPDGDPIPFTFNIARSSGADDDPDVYSPQALPEAT